MVRKSLADDEEPTLEEVLSALEDEDCRRIIRSLEEPRSAGELLDRCDIPRSTLYRKLDRLTDATLLLEGTEIRADGSHASRYEVNFDRAVVEYDGTRAELELELTRPARTADERLAQLWTEVRKET